MSQKSNEELIAECLRLRQENEHLRKLLKLDLHQP
jgi:hypothetical protein